ncbi:hypothetical protein G7046_g112 [Stylonectria norvegica]|nr:hypothetical protein G7046_g112 [Stylonectria norvegica]
MDNSNVHPSELSGILPMFAVLMRISLKPELGGSQPDISRRTNIRRPAWTAERMDPHAPNPVFLENLRTQAGRYFGASAAARVGAMSAVTSSSNFNHHHSTSSKQFSLSTPQPTLQYFIMQFATILVSVAALAIGASAAVLPRDTHVADFRVFGEAGCYKDNLGVFTVLDTDFTPNECKSFEGNVVKSLNLGDINDGCTMYIYPENGCGAGRRAIGAGDCQEAAGLWKSWSIQCATDANGN